jgi:hypothetical protein
LLLATGQLTEGGAYDVDFDHQFLEADKYDSKRTYKGFDGCLWCLYHHRQNIVITFIISPWF